MKVKVRDWNKYKNKISALSNKASDALLAWITSQGGIEMVDSDALVAYAYALSKKYGEGAATLSAMMYDAVAEASNAAVPMAIVADTATYSEVAKTINGILKVSGNEDYISSSAGRLVKQAAADTTMQNACRDGAEFAWISVGDTCAFCELLASNGWKKAGKNTLNGIHAEHIHANCDCEYAIRFDHTTTVEGYEPKKMYSDLMDTGENNWHDRVNALRREKYAENKDEINEQKRIAYSKRTEDEA